jgi:hypothetical protein
MSNGTSGDFIIRTRNILWREVAREGGSKELARAHVNLPAEVVKALELESKGDTVAFIIRGGSHNVILTNSIEPQPKSNNWEKDPQILLEQLLSQVILLKGRKLELLEQWDNGHMEDHQFTKQSKEIRNQLDSLTENLKKIHSTQFRGTTVADHLNMIINAKTQFDFNLYSNSIFDYLEHLIQNVRTNKILLNGIDSAYSKGLIEDLEYNQEKKELESKQKLLSQLLEQSRKILIQDV